MINNIARVNKQVTTKDRGHVSYALYFLNVYSLTYSMLAYVSDNRIHYGLLTGALILQSCHHDANKSLSHKSIKQAQHRLNNILSKPILTQIY